MDLLRIGDQLINLDRLSVVEGISGGPATLRLGDVSVRLDEVQSLRFVEYLGRHYGISELETVPDQGGKGRIVVPPARGQVLPDDPIA